MGRRKRQIYCTQCAKRGTCEEPCVFIDRLAGGDTPTRERGIVVEFQPERATEDYKEVLAQLAEARERAKYDINKIRAIDDERLRAIACLIYAGFDVKSIAGMQLPGININVIRAIEDERLRAVVCLLYGGFTIEEIKALDLPESYQWIYKLIRRRRPK